jgi:hypothetical protein
MRAVKKEVGSLAQSNKMRAKPENQAGIGLSRWRLWMELDTAVCASSMVACHYHSLALRSMVITPGRLLNLQETQMYYCSVSFCSVYFFEL